MAIRSRRRRRRSPDADRAAAASTEVRRVGISVRQGGSCRRLPIGTCSVRATEPALSIAQPAFASAQRRTSATDPAISPGVGNKQSSCSSVRPPDRRRRKKAEPVNGIACSATEADPAAIRSAHPRTGASRPSWLSPEFGRRGSSPHAAHRVVLDGRPQRLARFDVPESHGIGRCRPGQECIGHRDSPPFVRSRRLDRPWFAEQLTTVELPPQ